MALTAPSVKTKIETRRNRRKKKGTEKNLVFVLLNQWPFQFWTEWVHFEPGFSRRLCLPDTTLQYVNNLSVIINTYSVFPHALSKLSNYARFSE